MEQGKTNHSTFARQDLTLFSMALTCPFTDSPITSWFQHSGISTLTSSCHSREGERGKERVDSAENKVKNSSAPTGCDYVLCVLPQASEIHPVLSSSWLKHLKFLRIIFSREKSAFPKSFQIKKYKEYFSSPFWPLCHVEIAYYWMQGYDTITEPTSGGPKIAVTTTKYHWC